MAQLQGKVKRKPEGKSFMFIRSGYNDYFCHSSSCLDPFEAFNEGDTVNFTPEDSPKGPRAASVTLAAGNGS